MNRATATLLGALCATLSGSVLAERLGPTPLEIQNRLAALEVINVTSAKAPDPAVEETDPELLAILEEAEAAAPKTKVSPPVAPARKKAAGAAQMTPRGSSPTKN